MGANGANFKNSNNPNYKHGYALSKGKRPSFYNSWQNMKGRCLRQSHPKYDRYGGRGITICSSWMDINKFADWALSNGWKEGLSIDRVDNDGNYEPSNCVWVSVGKNSRKKSTTKISPFNAHVIRERVINGESEYKIADEYGVSHGAIWFIVNKYTHTSEGAHSLKKGKTK